ncbi:hypothetical protein [Pontibacter chitinilyticus]|uniref:hypothetical protein n=1 Tax=Pontibacter chitinilyticus TaxID=2674989 RepID=UPI00321AFC3C
MNIVYHNPFQVEIERLFPGQFWSLDNEAHLARESRLTYYTLKQKALYCYQEAVLALLRSDLHHDRLAFLHGQYRDVTEELEWNGRRLRWLQQK